MEKTSEMSAQGVSIIKQSTSTLNQENFGKNTRSNELTENEPPCAIKSVVQIFTNNNPVHTLFKGIENYILTKHTGNRTRCPYGNFSQVIIDCKCSLFSSPRFPKRVESVESGSVGWRTGYCKSSYHIKLQRC